jgi:hypothetical protein
MHSLGVLLLFVIVIYLSLNYAKNKFSLDKTEIIVKTIPLPTSFNDFFKERSLASDYSDMFGAGNINIDNASVDKSNSNSNKKVYVPQRFFVNI